MERHGADVLKKRLKKRLRVLEKFIHEALKAAEEQRRQAEAELAKLDAEDAEDEEQTRIHGELMGPSDAGAAC